MKTSQIITIIFTIALIGVFGFFIFRKNDGVMYTPPITEQTSSIKGCYVATLKKDVYTLSIVSEVGENVEGTLSFKNFEKDSSSGTFQGTYKAGILLGDYTFDSEGMHSVMQVIFQKVPNGFIRGFGSMNSTGDRFADLNNITYDSSYIFVLTSDCMNKTATDTSNWEIFSDPVKKITFKYPSTIAATYVSLVDWPPKLQIQNGPFTCTRAGNETDRAGQTIKKTINGKDYCMTQVTEGAAGSVYTQYAFATLYQNKVFIFTFSLRAIQCGNYNDPQKTACEKERVTFSIDPTIDQIMRTLVQS